jgi:hypothetical protein
MFPWCGTAGLSVLREAGDLIVVIGEEEELQEPESLSDQFGSLAGRIISERLGLPNHYQQHSVGMAFLACSFVLI